MISEKEYINRMVRRDQLRSKMVELLADCDDIGVQEFFNFESDRLLAKKVRVLKDLNDGKDPEEIGKDYYDILENLKVPDGQMIEIQGQIFDPHKYDE